MLSKPLGLIALLLERDAEKSHENSSRITANEAWGSTLSKNYSFFGTCI